MFTHPALAVAATTAAATALNPLARQTAFLVALLIFATAAWLVLRHRNGTFRRARRTESPELLAALGGTLGETATFVQFSSEVCSACPQVRRVLADVVAGRAGVVHVELSTEEHLDLVRGLGVMRTPTVLLLDRDGALRARTSGPLRPEQVAAALQDQSPRREVS